MSECILQGAKKVIFTACHSGKLKLTFTSPNIISTSPKSILMSRLISQFFCNLNSSKNFTCPSGKLRTEFSSLIAKSTSPRLLDITFFVRWYWLHCWPKFLKILHWHRMEVFMVKNYYFKEKKTVTFTWQSK